MAQPFEVVPIGVLRTPHKALEDCPRIIAADAAPCLVLLDPRYEDGLLGIEAATHIHLAYWMDRADRSRLQVVTPHDGVVRGVFANRSPARPNPISLRVVTLLSRDGARLTVSGLDCLDGTPLLDIKPYVPRTDCVETARLDWLRTDDKEKTR